MQAGQAAVERGETLIREAEEKRELLRPFHRRHKIERARHSFMRSWRPKAGQRPSAKRVATSRRFGEHICSTQAAVPVCVCWS